MLIPEEETVNTIVEKGTFYMPDIDNEPEEKSTLKKVLLWSVAGAAILLFLLSFLL